MTLEEYKLKIKEIEMNANIKKGELSKIYALSNNKVNIGDTIKDHIGSILVESIDIDIDFATRIPVCRYYGSELKKDLTPRKDNSKRDVWQPNLKS